MPIEIDILGHECDVVRLGNPLKTALIWCPSSVLISSDSASFASITGETKQRVKLRSQPSLGRKQKKTLLWLGVGAWRNKKPVLTLSAVTDEDGHTLENEDESGRRLCEYL